MSIDGDRAIVGAWQDLILGQINSAYVFERTGTSWSEKAKLTSSASPWVGDGFGHSVSIDANFAIVGAFGGRKCRIEDRLGICV